MGDARGMTRRGFVAACALALAGCAQAQDEPQGGPSGEAWDEPEAQTDTAVEDETSLDAEPSEDDQAHDGVSSAGGKVLVAYYSRADENYAGGGTEWLDVGHTKVMAGYVADALGADSYEIVPAEPYPEGYDACCDVALEEQRDDARPAIAGDLPDVTPYDLVFIGCPIWWGDEPMIVRTFLDGVDLSGKLVVPFTTHGGSGLGSVPANLQAALPEARVLDGHAVAGTVVDGARDEVEAWAKGLALA